MKEYRFDAVVVGSGAAGYSAALRVQSFGKKTVALVTEDKNAGTSRNAGSDKQTYYKLSLGGAPDSVREMAEDLFRGGATDGDTALCEAALSVRCFLYLTEAGVPFPNDAYGVSPGYKTDHDPRERAASAGPLTSKMMTEALEAQAQRQNVPVFDGLLAAKVLTAGTGADKQVCGLLCVDKDDRPVLFRCENVILCTGGPAGIFRDSVYPASQTGASGLALDAGAALQNATEWQFGLASVAPRWNVSGTYMQVLPRFVSVGPDGDEREFLSDAFGDPYLALSQVFLKGYQWPFDAAKLPDGSSRIDLLVYRETKLKGRRVYLDYRKNPFGLAGLDFSRLSPEAREYLARSGACFGTPIERLEKMNAPAVELYRSKGVDLHKEPLEIALCAQHHNGGIAVDCRWQTSVRGLFAAGECAGTHGVRRPGGATLNAGQVGALRAAEYLSFAPRASASAEACAAAAESALAELYALSAGTGSPVHTGDAALAAKDNGDSDLPAEMSRVAGAIRVPSEIQKLLDNVIKTLGTPSACPQGLREAVRRRDRLLTAGAVLAALADFAREAKCSRGSAVLLHEDGLACPGLPETFRFAPVSSVKDGEIQTVSYDADAREFTVSWRPVRPIPQTDASFETLWAEYRKSRG